jgi:hypothetical protein
MQHSAGTLVDATHDVGAVARAGDNAVQLSDRIENDRCTGLQARNTARSVIDAHESILARCSLQHAQQLLEVSRQLYSGGVHPNEAF